MRKNKKVAIIDIDGVLADFEAKFCEDFGNANRHLYNLQKRYPELDPELISEWVNNEENYKDLNPIFGGITLLNELKAKGWYIILCTVRSKSLITVTTNWLELYHINYNEIRFSPNKLQTVQNILEDGFEIGLVVDDNVETLEAIKGWLSEIVCICWVQPWNSWTDYFPKAIYNRENYHIEVNMGDNIWKWIWSK